MFADVARPVLHRSPGKARSREGRCLVQGHRSSKYALSIPKVRGRGQREMILMGGLSERRKTER